MPLPVTAGPGLAGALLVGILYAKGLAFGLGKPLVAVNHLEGHIHAVLMEATDELRGAEPLLALVVSGGHTHLYLASQVDGLWRYENVGRTVDDAAGEAYDKVAKLLGLAYPGGPWMDVLAAHGDPAAVRFSFGEIKSRDGAERFDFSFSGIKTAVLRYVQAHGLAASSEARRAALAAAPETTAADAVTLCDAQTLGLIASFQSAVVGNLLRQTWRAAERFGARGVLVSGGVGGQSRAAPALRGRGRAAWAAGRGFRAWRWRRTMPQ